MADISQELKDGVLTFTALSDRGRDWMVKNHDNATVSFTLATQLRAANEFMYRAVGDQLLITPLPST